MADAGRTARRRPPPANGAAAAVRAPCCGLPSPLASAIRTTVALPAMASAAATAPAAAKGKRARGIA